MEKTKLVLLKNVFPEIMVGAPYPMVFADQHHTQRNTACMHLLVEEITGRVPAGTHQDAFFQIIPTALDCGSQSGQTIRFVGQHASQGFLFE